MEGAALPVGMDMTTSVFLHEAHSPQKLTSSKQHCIDRASKAFMLNDWKESQIMTIYVDKIRIRQVIPLFRTKSFVS